MSLPPRPPTPGLESMDAQPDCAEHSAQYLREVAIGYLFLADITADKIQNAKYMRIARRHFQLAETAEKSSAAKK
jgi:hypothetical protein